MISIVRKPVKYLVLMCLLFCVCKNVQAQKLVFLYAHGLYANPLDKNFNNNYNSGIGVEGGAGLGWGKTFLVATIGYSSFSGSDKNTYGRVKYVPMKLGLRQYIFSKMIYLHGDLGIGRIKNDLYNNQSRFSGDFGAGVKFAGFEVQVDYDGFTRNTPEPSGYSSWIALKAGFNLGL